MLKDILIFSGNEIFESASNPFIGVHLLSFLFIVHGNSVVVLEVVLELVGFLELFEEKFVKLILARAVLRIHSLEHPVEQFKERLNLSVTEPLDLHQVGHVKVTFRSTIGCTILEDVLYPLSSGNVFTSFFSLAQFPQHPTAKSGAFAHAGVDKLFFKERIKPVEFSASG